MQSDLRTKHLEEGFLSYILTLPVSSWMCLSPASSAGEGSFSGEPHSRIHVSVREPV